MVPELRQSQPAGLLFLVPTPFGTWDAQSAVPQFASAAELTEGEGRGQFYLPRMYFLTFAFLTAWRGETLVCQVWDMRPFLSQKP